MDYFLRATEGRDREEGTKGLSQNALRRLGPAMTASFLKITDTHTDDITSTTDTIARLRAGGLCAVPIQKRC